MAERCDHPFDLESMGRDPNDEELDQLSDHQLAELYRDVAAGAGSIDLYDELLYRLADRFDTYEAEGRLNPARVVVDGRFTSEGISVSMYEMNTNIVLDETWYTYDEIEEMKSDEESHFTFEFEVNNEQ